MIALAHDGRAYEFRLGQIADEVARRVEGVRQNRFAYDLPPGSSRQASLAAPTTFGPPATFFLNLPQLFAWNEGDGPSKGRRKRLNWFSRFLQPKPARQVLVKALYALADHTDQRKLAPPFSSYCNRS